MKQTGQVLKSTRKKQGISISEVSMATKISARVIERMEEGATDDMPPLTFLRGFVRTYATYLKLDADKIMSEFNQEMGIVDDHLTSHQIEETPPPQPSWLERLPFLQGRLKASNALAAAAVILLIFIIAGIKNTIEKYENERQVAPTSVNPITENAPPEDTAPAEFSEQTLEAETPKEPVKQDLPIEKETDVTVPKEVSNETSPAPPPEPPPVAEKTPEEKPAASDLNNQEKIVEQKTDSLPAAERQSAMAEEITKLPINPQEVIIQALDHVNILFRVDGGPLERIKLKPEEVHAIKGNKKIAIDFSDGGAVNLIHNGKDRGVPGKLGQQLKVVFPGYSKTPM
ncbi:MAG: helix-turn-helix domain-containing protein [Pseudobdellovibrionaceae bacterium]|nr:helix-turn-helix domain-containing protein [Bdellovibrionales bacterium]USN46960.1 MAG: helix-turn-helix domain-containing protein [Pseudobdellovibrionaceae bacterium]